MRKGLADIVRVSRNAMSFSNAVRGFESLLSSSPAFPTATTPQLEASHVLSVQPLMTMHLRYDLTPPDPLIAMEKALRKSLPRGIMGAASAVELSDPETAFMSRVSGLSMEPPMRRHKDAVGKKPKSKKGDKSGSDSDSDSSGDEGTAKEPVLKVTPTVVCCADWLSMFCNSACVLDVI